MADACVAPGTEVLTDAAGDQAGAPVSNTQFDIQSVSFAEPNWAGLKHSTSPRMIVLNLVSPMIFVSAVLCPVMSCGPYVPGTTLAV